MIERQPLHEDCGDCKHVIEVPIPEGPKTLAQTQRDAMWDQIYGAFVREMLCPPQIVDLLRKDPPDEEGTVSFKVR